MSGVGIIAVTGGITYLNQFANGVFADKQNQDRLWTIPLATGALAVLFAGLDKAAPKFSTLLAATALITVFVTDISGTSPAGNIMAIAARHGILAK